MYNSLRDKSDISCYYTFNSRFNGLLKPLQKKKKKKLSSFRGKGNVFVL